MNYDLRSYVNALLFSRLNLNVEFTAIPTKLIFFKTTAFGTDFDFDTIIS
jgi:hypothetical protein